ncbi:MAG: hypothetical protein ACLQNE_14820 [Thermoguttaceae bacterium]
MKHILFFALKEDLLALLELVESKGSLKYVLTGNFLADEIKDGPTVFATGAAIPNLGKATAESAIACESFLVCEQETPINLDAVHGRTSKRVCVDQLANPDTVTFTPGGVWNEDVVLHGRTATASESQISQVLMKRFQAAIKKAFTKVKAFYVGPKALTLLESGKRLTISAQSPREFDLAPPLAKN